MNNETNLNINNYIHSRMILQENQINILNKSHLNNRHTFSP